MLGLILDTSRKPALLALIENGGVIEKALLEDARQLSNTLFPSLIALLGGKIKELAFIAVGVGPGSYMGIRTAATVAQTLSFALKIPLIEFCSLLAFLPEGHSGPFTFVDDAKMGQYYIVRGAVEKNILTELFTPQLIDPEEVIKYDHRIEDPVPNLEWIAEYVHVQYIKGNISTSPKLIYLR